MSNSHSRTHVGPEEVESLHWLNIEYRVNYLTLVYAHSIYYNLAATYLSENFTKISDTHHYRTRLEQVTMTSIET